MVSSVSSDSTAMQQLMAQLNQKMKAADTDGKSGLSKTELASVDAGSDTGGAGFLKSLTEQFDSLDADKNGQLSSSEVAAVKPPADSTSSTSTNSIETLLEKMMARVMQEMSTALGGTTTPTADTLTSALTSAADTDGTAGLSKAELTSVNSSSDTGKAFVNGLISNFDKIDTDGNGQLSASEITASKPTVTASTTSSNSLSDLGNDLKSMSQSFVKNLLSTYQNGGLSALESSLNIAV